MLALETWDAGIWRDLVAREVEVARELGAAFHVKHGLNGLAFAAAFMGDLAAAEDFAHEARLIAEVTGTPLLQYAEMVLAAYRGNAPEATRAVAAILQEAESWNVQLHVTSANWALALLNNALGRHDVARATGLIALEGIDVAFGPLVVPELAEAASRTGDRPVLEKLDDWICEQARLTGREVSPRWFGLLVPRTTRGISTIEKRSGASSMPPTGWVPHVPICSMASGCDDASVQAMLAGSSRRRTAPLSPWGAMRSPSAPCANCAPRESRCRDQLRSVA
jgi:hypothetical protein